MKRSPPNLGNRRWAYQGATNRRLAMDWVCPLHSETRILNHRRLLRLRSTVRLRRASTTTKKETSQVLPESGATSS